MRSEEEKLADAKDAKALQENLLLQRILSAMDKLCYNLIQQADYDDTTRLQQLKVTAEVTEKFTRLIQQSISEAKVADENKIKHVWEF